MLPAKSAVAIPITEIVHIVTGAKTKRTFDLAIM